MKHFFVFFCFFVTGMSVFAGEKASMEPDWSWSCDDRTLNIRLVLPAGYYAYPEETAPELSPSCPPQTNPPVKKHKDPLLNAEIEIFTGPGIYQWTYPLKKLRFPLRITARWQMCRDTKSNVPGTCMIPGQRVLAFFASADDMIRQHSGKISGEKTDTDPVDEVNPNFESPIMLASCKIIRSASGYLSPKDFSAFLNGTAPSAFTFAGKGILASLLLALLGGLALNLTPCVLPLIPVNLAVIGAGVSGSGSRWSRIRRGSLYGAGIACTYGILGVVAVLTGSAFGNLDSSWVFNLCVSIIFLALGFAMLGLFTFDLSPLSNRLHLTASTKSGGIFLMGALSAILAGACVAPVIAAALVQASNMAAAGNYAGLLLPFLVGTGMALPWPFAAAGISLFPKPGAWMKYVRQVLAMLILALAAYYIWTTVSLFTAQYDVENNPEGAAVPRSVCQQINDALKKSAETGKPVLLDFGTSWCKACRMMEVKTLRDPEVVKGMQNVILLKLNMDQPSDPASAEILKTFQVTGFPSFLLIRPESKP